LKKYQKFEKLIHVNYFCGLDKLVIFFHYFSPKNSSVATAMQRFFEENYRKNLSLKFIHINNVTHLSPLPKKRTIHIMTTLEMTKKSVINTDFAKDTIKGLEASQKRLFSKYFYDKKGDKLFQDIMAMPEYYLTNSEFEIFETQKAEILEYINGDDFDLIELGAGDGTKTKILLEYLVLQNADFQYLPIDISQNALDGLESDLNVIMPQVKVKPQQGDYFDVLKSLKNIGSRRKMVLFLGSNIGNFTKEEAVLFLKEMNASLAPNDLVLIGSDLKKDPSIIQLAYDDPAGITAAFNLNLLERMNRELGANFDIKEFKHWETYNPTTGETKSHIISKKAQVVHFSCLEKTFKFAAWEAIWVELSQKYNLQDLEKLAADSGFELVNHFLDKKVYFCDTLWRV
jgi:L-histidine N-alpha-methyltransferase